MMLPVLHSEPTAGTTCKAVIFAIAHHQLALPLSAIFRITQYSPTLRHSVDKKELLLLDGHPLTPLNLHPVLKGGGTVEERSPTISPYLVIARHRHHLYAIPVDAPPTLIDIPFANVHPLSPTYCQDIGHLANQVAILDDAQTQVLLLNLMAACPTI